MNREQLNYYFEYHRDAGKLYWKNHWAANKKKFLGKEAGSLSTKGGKKYREIMVEGVTFPVHRLIFFLENDEYPKMVDHFDGDTLNNHHSNLRKSNQSHNMRNLKFHRDNKDRLAGCYYDKKQRKWKARVELNNVRYNLGSFDTQLKAHLAYCVALTELGIT